MVSPMRRPFQVLAAMAAAGLAAAAGVVALAPDSGAQSPSPPDAAATVVLQNRQFNPSTVTLDRAGLVVRWTHRDGSIGHSITFDPPSTPSDSHPSCTGESDPNCFQEGEVDHFVLFETPGTFKYHCKVHAGMTGVVTVAGTAPTRATTTTTRGATPTTAAGTGTTIGTLATTSTTVEETTTSSSSTTSSSIDFSTATTTPTTVEVEEDEDDQASGLLLAIGVLLLAAVVAALIPAWRRLT
jgi:plastocyanin